MSLVKAMLESRQTREVERGESVDRYVFLDHRIRLDYVMKAISHLRPHRVIDFGCGETPIQDMNFDLYVGIDVDEDAINPSKFSKPNFKLLKANYEESLHLPQIFDLVLWSEGPEHTLKHKEVFDNIRKVLLPKGFLIVTCPNERKWSLDPKDRINHKCTFGIEDLHLLVKQNKFTVLEIAEIYSRIQEDLIGYHWLFCLSTKAPYDPRYV